MEMNRERMSLRNALKCVQKIYMEQCICSFDIKTTSTHCDQLYVRVYDYGIGPVYRLNQITNRKHYMTKNV